MSIGVGVAIRALRVRRPSPVSARLDDRSHGGHSCNDDDESTGEQTPRRLVLDEGVDEVVGGDDVVADIGAILTGFEGHPADGIAERADLSGAQNQYGAAFSGTYCGGEVTQL